MFCFDFGIYLFEELKTRITADLALRYMQRGIILPIARSTYYFIITKRQMCDREQHPYTLICI